MTARIKTIAAVVVFVVLAASLFLGSRYLEQINRLPEGLIQANGRIEGDAVVIASKVSGRILELLVQEGDTVSAGQLIVRLEDATARAQLEQARATLLAARARADAARKALAVTSKEVPCNIAAAEAGLDSAQALVDKAQAAEQQAGRDARRFRQLVEAGTVDAQTAEQAELAWEQAKDELLAARAAVIEAGQRLTGARLGPDRVAAQQAEVAAVEATVLEAEARVAEAETALNELTIESPAAGTVTTRLADLGEVVNAGTPLFELVDLDRLYLKVYIPEVQIGKVRRGLAARIHTDAFPARPFAATLRYIAARAEFTPKEVQTPDERVKLVYAVKLYIDENPEHRLTPGLPADAVIRWREDVEWAPPRW